MNDLIRILAGAVRIERYPGDHDAYGTHEFSILGQVRVCPVALAGVADWCDENFPPLPLGCPSEGDRNQFSELPSLNDVRQVVAWKPTFPAKWPGKIGAGWRGWKQEIRGVMAIRFAVSAGNNPHLDGIAFSSPGFHVRGVEVHPPIPLALVPSRIGDELPLVKWLILCRMFDYSPLKLLAACAVEATASTK